jgi:hypothetical protein
MLIQPSSDAIRIPAPGMSEGSITSRSARQNGPYPVAWMAGTEGPAAASARTASPASGPSFSRPGPDPVIEAPQEGRERAKNLLWAAGKLAGHRSRSAPVHQAGGAGCGSSAGLVCEGPCTGGAASLTFAWRALTASRVILKTVRSWVTVTGPV